MWLPRPTPVRRLQRLTIAVLLLGLGHLPLPVADYHVIRHEDGPRQVCRLHDHLLRWHPEARGSVEVATLHWHWLPPVSLPEDSSPEGSPRIDSHAHELPEMTPDAAPRLASSGPIRLQERSSSDFSPMPPRSPFSDLKEDPGWSGCGPSFAHAFTSTFPPRSGLSALLQRWTC